MTPAQLATLKAAILAAALSLLSFAAGAQSLTPTQIVTLRTAVLAEPTLATARQTGNDVAIAAWCNATSVGFVAWRSSVSVLETGQSFNGSEWAGMTSANHSRLQTVAQYLSGGYNASKSDLRAMFNDIWSGAGGAATRANLLALWKRSGTNAERVLSTGTGSDASPSTLGYEGQVSQSDASLLR